MAADTGLVLDSLDSYATSDRALAIASLGMSNLVQVAAVASGSPAAKAGILAGDGVVSVNDGDITALIGSDAQVADKATRTRALAAMAGLARLPAGEPARITLSRGERHFTVTLVPQNLCSSRFFVSTANELNAYSDGIDVVITARLVDFTQTADELALLAGHELAHAVARDDRASGVPERRAMEDRADALGTDLAACAGYDTKGAASFWQRWDKPSVLDFLSDGTHSPGRERTIAVQQRAFPAACPITGAPPLQAAPRR